MTSETEQYERIRTAVFQSSDEAVRLVAASIARLIRRRQDEGRNGRASGWLPARLRSSSTKN